MRNLLIVLVSWISLAGCATGSKSTNELMKRMAKQGEPFKPKHIRGKKYQSTERVRLGGRYLDTGDWFHGCWVSITVEEKDHVFDDPILKKITKSRN